MRFTISPASARSALVGMAGLIFLVLGAHAQERPSGQADPSCAAACNERGYAADYCSRVCWIPDRPRTPPDEVTDWSCMSACAERGGKYAECKPRCRAR
jgi:hypothetical protein